MRKALMSIAVAVAGLAAPAAAHAQTYVVPACNTGSAPHSMSGWAPIPTLETGTFNTCNVGGGFGVYQPLTPDTFGYWQFQAPADVRISALRVWRHGTLSAHGNYQLSSRRSDSDILELETELNVPPTNTLAEFTGLNTIDAAFTVFCHEYTGGCGPDPTQNRVTFTRVEMVLEDKSPPRAVGALSTTAAGFATDFTDAGGGVREATLVVDGAEVGRNAMGCPEPYRTAVPCPLSGRAEVAFDTRSLANGAHHIQLALTDVAGNRTLTNALNVDVQNVVDTTPVPSLRPGRVVATKRTVRARHDRRPVIAATVVDATGAPIVGSPVAVETRRNVRGSRYTAGQPAVTDARGRVSLRLPSGPSRVVRLTYGDSVATVTVKVRAPLRLSVSPKSTRNQGTVRLTGSVAGTKLPTRVELQAFSGGHWFPFKTVALRKGKFSARYRFTRTFSAQRYRFRAVLHTDRDFPYEAATSPVVAVSVRP